MLQLASIAIPAACRRRHELIEIWLAVHGNELDVALHYWHDVNGGLWRAKLCGLLVDRAHVADGLPLYSAVNQVPARIIGAH